MEEQILGHISELFPLLHSVYKATNITYQVLDVNCYEHQNVLKRWVLPVTEETYECTCKPCFDEPEEMVNDIDDAIERAKAARKIVNKVECVQLHKNGIVNTGSKNLIENPHIKEVTQKVSDSRYRKIEKNKNNSSGNKNAVAAKDKGIARYVTQVQSKRNLNTKLNKSIPFQTTYQKDFSVRNSLAISQSMKCRVRNSLKWHATPTTTKVDHTLVTVDVDSLLKKVTSGGVPKSCPNMKVNLVSNVGDNTCVVHSALPLPVIHRCVNLKEAMNVCGVPSDLVKLLKTYHQYISADKLRSKRKVCGRDSFLQKLNESNQNGWDHSTPEPTNELCLHFLLIFVDILSKNKTELRGNLLIKLEEQFNILVRGYNKILDTDTVISKVLPTKKKPEFTSPDVAEKCEWAVAGLWNKKSWSVFSGLKGCLKISYENKEDCMLFQKRIQEIQKLHLQIEILEMLKNVLPHMNDLQTDHVAISNIYKSCSALCNISSLSVPVLLKM